ncbi:coiled-coil domain-containing protein [Roseococcus pinisoli]|uniref:Uncharacterized protein n=1 Tax=Roseococcus pinisoli TaxID=2835040 RepID=A0ABS5QCJ2_9PROT|nr:hypothetical protein [Roseococcus pinisoli]MBS7811228.1 hypothetical protein [Roseococcus pinisoli]
MGVETAIIAGLSVASAAGQAAAGASAASSSAKLSAQQAAEQAKQLGLQQQMGELNKLVAESQYDSTMLQLDDAAYSNALSRAELGIAQDDLKTRRGALASAALRAGVDADLVLANADLTMRGIAIQRASARAETVNTQAKTMAEAAAALGTLDAIQAEAGLSGTTVLALARGIAHTEGADIGEAQRGSREAMATLDLDRQKAGISTASSLLDLQGQVEQIEGERANLVSSERKAALQTVALDLQDRAIERDRHNAGVDIAAKRIGATTQNATIASQANVLGIQQRQAELAASMAVTNGIFSVVNSGLQVAGNYFNQQRQTAREAARYEALRQSVLR